VETGIFVMAFHMRESVGLAEIIVKSGVGFCMIATRGKFFHPLFLFLPITDAYSYIVPFKAFYVHECN
jgi:hypothetical protein